MFKSARWRNEKNKVKAEFKLQFHVTQVPQSAGDALTLSVVPGDVGKPTARLDKASVRDGICKWENPVYETVKFVRDAKSGKLNEKTYYFLVSMGRAKSRLFGEVSINIADYAEATKSSSFSLPLKNSNSDAVMHISIQKMQANIEAREDEDVDDASARSQVTNLKTYLTNSDTDGSNKSNCTEDEHISKSLHDAELNGDCRASSGSDITLSSSESSSGLDTPREFRARNNNPLKPVCSPSLPHKPEAFLSTATDNKNQRSQLVWSVGSDQGVSIDDSSSDMLPREKSEPVSRSDQGADIEIEKLKAELVVCSRQAEMSDLELQTLRKQIVKESKKSQDLSREISILKEERVSLRVECEKLKAFQIQMEVAKSTNSQLEEGNMEAVLDLKRELNYEKELNANLRLQLQKTQESNNELVLAMRDLEEMLEQKNGETVHIFDKSSFTENAGEFYNTISKCDSEDDEEQKALEKLVKQHSNANETYMLEQKVIDLYSEVEFYKREKDELEMYMEQLALDFEILKQENHDMSYKLEQCELQEKLSMKEEFTPSATIEELETHIENLDRELKQQSKDFSDSLITIKELKAHIQELEEGLVQQAEGYEADLEAMTRAKIEQEQRAIQAEDALRKTRWRNSNTAQRLQEEIKRLSVQITSAFNENQKVAAKALAESKELKLQKSQLDEKLKQANKDLQSVKVDYEAKLSELSSMVDLKTSQIEQMFLELHTKSKLLEQHELQKEVCESLSREILLLKYEIGRLTTENGSLQESESEIKNLERNELVITIALIKKESEKLQRELNRLRHLKDKHEISVGCLQTELELLRAQCNDLKHSLVEDEVDKEKLSDQVFQLKDELKKVEELNDINKLRHSEGHISPCDGIEVSMESHKSNPTESSPIEVASLREKIELLEGLIISKEKAIETLANSSSKVEMDFWHRIQELESRFEEVTPTSAFQVNGCKSNIIMSGGITSSSTEEYGNVESVGRTDNTAAEKEFEACKVDNSDNRDNFSAEVGLLRERNKSMESELKEMQERYSEISLKFAEVEGERQQLVMTLRSIKNSKKN